MRAGTLPSGFASGLFLAPSFAACHPDACTRIDAWIDATSPQNLAWELEAAADSPSLVERLASFSGSVLARTGALDRAAPPDHAQAIARACPGGLVQIVANCGHALLEEDPDGTIAAVVSALA